MMLSPVGNRFSGVPKRRTSIRKESLGRLCRRLARHVNEGGCWIKASVRRPPQTRSPGKDARLGVFEMLKSAANDDERSVRTERAFKDAPLHEIVIVGGGAAGLELRHGPGQCTRKAQERAVRTRRQSSCASLEATSTFRGSGRSGFRRACARSPCPSALASLCLPLWRADRARPRQQANPTCTNS